MSTSNKKHLKKLFIRYKAQQIISSLVLLVMFSISLDLLFSSIIQIICYDSLKQISVPLFLNILEHKLNLLIHFKTIPFITVLSFAFALLYYINSIKINYSNSFDADKKIANWKSIAKKNNKSIIQIIIFYVTFYFFIGIAIDSLLKIAFATPFQILEQNFTETFCSILLSKSTQETVYGYNQNLPLFTIMFMTYLWFYIKSVLEHCDKYMLFGEYKKITKNTTETLKEQRLINIMEEIVLSTGTYIKPHIYIVESESINCYSFGLGENSSIVVTSSMLEKFNRNQLQSIIAFHIVKIIENGVGMLHYLNAFSTPFHNLLAYRYGDKKVESNNKIKKNILNIMNGLLGPFTFLIFILFIINHNFNRLLKPMFTKGQITNYDDGVIGLTKDPHSFSEALSKIAISSVNHHFMQKKEILNDRKICFAQFIETACTCDEINKENKLNRKHISLLIFITGIVSIMYHVYIVSLIDFFYTHGGKLIFLKY